MSVYSRYCSEPHTVEAVRVFSADGQTSVVYPELPYRTETVSVDAINDGIGISESAEKIASLLTRMCLKSAAVDNGTSISVEVSSVISL